VSYYDNVVRIKTTNNISFPQVLNLYLSNVPLSVKALQCCIIAHCHKKKTLLASDARR
jgi:hypothetical protein